MALSFQKIMILVLISSIVFFAGCTTTTSSPAGDGTLKNVTTPGELPGSSQAVPYFTPISLLTDEKNTNFIVQVELSEKTGIQSFIEGKTIKLKLSQGLELVSGPFSKIGNDYYLPIENTVPEKDRGFNFTVKTLEKGIQLIDIEVLQDRNNSNRMRVDKIVKTICISDSSEKATEFCSASNPLIQNKVWKCIDESLKLGQVAEQYCCGTKECIENSTKSESAVIE